MPIISNFPGGTGSGGGGIVLAPVTEIKTLVSSGKVYVKWTDPADIIVEGSPLATWAGTLLVRKAGAPPSSRRDGVIVLDSKERNQYSTKYFCDSGLSNGVTYYYKFFPYTTTNAYTDSGEDEFSAIPTAQVSGIDTWNVTSISASTEAGDGKINVTWSDPSLTIVSDGVELATWASTTIVVKEGGYATSKDDVDAVFSLKETSRGHHLTVPLSITGLTNGTTYYISFFPETTDGGINTSTKQRATGVANRITISTVPSQSGKLTYNKSSQSPTWSNYNTARMTIGGTTSGTNAGSYNATFTPKTDYRWSDGSTTAKTVAWTISKATGTLTVNKTSIELNTSVLSATFTIGGNYDGSLNVSSNNTGVAKVSRNGTTVTVTHVNQTTGSATITVSCTAGTNYTAPANKTVAVNAKFVSSVLNENDWSVISSVSAKGEGDIYWDVGDRKAVAINGTVGAQAINGTYYCFILGFNHNSSREGNGIHFQFGKTALTGGTDIAFIDGNYGNTGSSAGFRMNTSNTNSGGWNNSYMRKTICPAFLNALPAALKNVIKDCTKYTDNTGGGKDTASYVTATTDKIFLLAEWEIFGARTYANSAEKNYQAQYAYYSSGNSKVKYRHSATGSTAIWWGRSPNYAGSLSFCGVGTSGGASAAGADISRGLAPAFKV